MAAFSDDLFNVFEEEPEKRSAKAKKRRRDDNAGLSLGEEKKKTRVDEADPSSSSAPDAGEEEPFPEDAEERET